MRAELEFRLGGVGTCTQKREARCPCTGRRKGIDLAVDDLWEN